MKELRLTPQAAYGVMPTPSIQPKSERLARLRVPDYIDTAGG
jgi:hypothetical protein